MMLSHWIDGIPMFWDNIMVSSKVEMFVTDYPAIQWHIKKKSSMEYIKACVSETCSTSNIALINEKGRVSRISVFGLRTTWVIAGRF
jgi:hypothetical protein